MKKMLMVLAMVSLSATAFAQTEVPTEKFSVATNSFWSNWFIQLHAADVNYMETNHGQGLMEAPMWGGTLSLGKWFTPGMGMRVKAGYGKLHNRAWAPESPNHIKYGTLDVNAMFSVSNMLCGYSETRVWNFIPYVSGGLMKNMTDHFVGATLGFGAVSTWKLSKRVNLDLEASYKAATSAIVGTAKNNQTRGKDHMFAVEAGITVNLGKATWNKTPDLDAIMAANQSQLDALNAALQNAQAENAKLRELLAQKPKETIVTKETVKMLTTPGSVFFNIGKSKIASKKDLVNVENLANVAKENGSTIVVTGYADSKTGSASLNQTLSEKRAEAVKAALVDMGVDASKIQTVANGGVDTLSPISYNRRATVEIK